MNKKTLREYQSKQIKKLLRGLKVKNIAGLFSAVGSGKTLVTKIVLKQIFNNKKLFGIDKIIIAAPFINIADGFAVKDIEIYKQEINNLYNSESYVLDQNDFIFHKKSNKIRKLKNILLDSNNTHKHRPHIFTHSTLSQIKDIVSNELFMENVLFVIDEAHRCLLNESDDYYTDLSFIIDSVLKKSAKVLFLTATPYRVAGSKLLPVISSEYDYTPVVRTIGEQINDGYSPNIDVEYINIKNTLIDKQKHTTILDSNNTKFKTCNDIIIYAEHVYDEWVKDGCPKSIIVIPGGNSEKVAEQIIKFFHEQDFPVAKKRGRLKPNILNAVGSSNSKKETVLAELDADKDSQGRKYDIAIGCRRFDMGTDVPSASHIYTIGVPSNICIYHQRNGRVLRFKKDIKGYGSWFGKRWINKSKAVFFVPLHTKIKNLDKQVARQLVHCIVAGERYKEYCESLSVSIEIKKVIEKKMSSGVLTTDQGDVITDVIESLQVSQEIDSDIIISDFIIDVAKTPNINIETFAKKMLESVGEEKSLAIITIVDQLDLPKIVKNNFINKVVSKLCKVVKKSTNDKSSNLNPSNDIFNELKEAFDDIIVKFGKKKVVLKSSEKFDKVLVSLTGDDIKTCIEECEWLFDNEERSNEMCRDVCEWIKVNGGKYPDGRWSNDFIEKKYGIWINHRKAANQGKGGNFYKSDLLIAESYGYSDLFDIIDLEKFSNEMCRKVCGCIKANGGKSLSIVIGEKYFNWINFKKQAKQGKGSYNFYESDQEIAESCGCSDLFDNLEKKSNMICREVCEWIQNHNDKMPRQKAKDFIEKGYGSWISVKKGTNQGKGSGKFYKSDQLIAESYGYVNLFDDLEEKSNKMCYKVCEWVQNHNDKYPSHGSKGHIEKMYANWISDKKKLKKVTSRGKFYKSDQDIIESYGYSDLFDVVDREKLSNEMCYKVCEWVKLNNKTPFQNSENIIEKKYAFWIRNRRVANQGKGDSNFYKSDQEIAELYGYSDLFDILNRVEKSNEMCRKVCEWIKNNNGRCPNKRSKDSTEKKFGSWVSNKRISKRGISRGKFYKSDQKIAKSYGYSDLLGKNNETDS